MSIALGEGLSRIHRKCIAFELDLIACQRAAQKEAQLVL